MPKERIAMLENENLVAKADKYSIDEDGNTNTYSLAQKQS